MRMTTFSYHDSKRVKQKQEGGGHYFVDYWEDEDYKAYIRRCR
jgi:hypothetical protein